MFSFSHHLHEFKTMIIGLVLVLASAIIGLIWLSIGLHSFMTALIGPIWGPFALGAVFIIPLLGYGFYQIHNPKARRNKAQAALNSAYADSSIHHISKIIEALSTKNPFLATAAAILAGFLATRFPSLLSLFAQIVVAYVQDVKMRAQKDAANAANSDEPPSAKPRPRAKTKTV